MLLADVSRLGPEHVAERCAALHGHHHAVDETDDRRDRHPDGQPLHRGGERLTRAQVGQHQCQLPAQLTAGARDRRSSAARGPSPAVTARHSRSARVGSSRRIRA